MSTYVHIECLDHDPVLVANGESGQHLYDLPQIRADIADRDRHVANVADDIWPDDYFRRNTVSFLAQHPRCRLGIRDEYGVEHPIEAKEDIRAEAWDKAIDHVQPFLDAKTCRAARADNPYRKQP